MKIKTKSALYHVYQETEFKRTKVRECIVSRASFMYYCGRHSYSAFLEAKLIPKPIEVSPENCEAAFLSQKLKINAETELIAKVGIRTQETITIGGEILADGECTGRTITRKGSIVNYVV